MDRFIYEGVGKSNRRVTAASLRTFRTLQAHKDRSENDGPSRLQALVVTKRYAAAIGLKAAKIALIDQLFAFTKSVDWEDGASLKLIWPSNDVLARRLGIKISTLKYHLAGLVEAMLINHSDHPTYHRKGQRDDTGRIFGGYGIDLSPIAARYSLMLEVATAAEAQAREIKELSYSRTNLRRQIEALARRAGDVSGEVHESWDSVVLRLREMTGRKASTPDEMRSIVATLIGLRDEAVALLETVLESQKIDPAQTIFRPLQTTAYLSDSIVCNDEMSCANAQHKLEESASGATAYEEGHQAEPKEQGSTYPLQRGRSKTSVFSIEMVRAAMSNLVKMVPEVFENWAALSASGPTICRLCSINPQVYGQAISEVGQERAVIALIITAERYANGSVENPGGYLRAMIDRGRDGKLYLDRSLHAMAADASRHFCT